MARNLTTDRTLSKATGIILSIIKGCAQALRGSLREQRADERRARFTLLISRLFSSAIHPWL